MPFFDVNLIINSYKSPHADIGAHVEKMTD